MSIYEITRTTRKWKCDLDCLVLSSPLSYILGRAPLGKLFHITQGIILTQTYKMDKLLGSDTHLQCWWVFLHLHFKIQHLSCCQKWSINPGIFLSCNHSKWQNDIRYLNTFMKLSVLSPINVNSAYLTALCTKQVFLQHSLSPTVIAWRNSENSPANIPWIYSIVPPENKVCCKLYTERLLQVFSVSACLIQPGGLCCSYW